ncbi:putative disease resistance protein RF45 [Prunus yedoensis var. nudiflora]|uniref:Putative disease resistance protein RF45 n=1 Tax=Prunus yedoensis var. nudiflora TaxID=2094558 RepID=A0A314Y4P1_PRUYE|nr:putative disease resistance protein RF45 [Prunus yedoensis var. nudiflora]
MFKSMFQDVHGMKLPAGIGSLKNLLTLTAIHAGGGIAEELGNLIQLRRLGMMDVDEENIKAKHAFDKGNHILLDSFSPPPFLQKLRLEGVLEKLPTSFGSLERLTTLRLGNSIMSENS